MRAKSIFLLESFHWIMSSAVVYSIFSLQKPTELLHSAGVKLTWKSYWDSLFPWQRRKVLRFYFEAILLPYLTADMTTYGNRSISDLRSKEKRCAPAPFSISSETRHRDFKIEDLSTKKYWSDFPFGKEERSWHPTSSGDGKMREKKLQVFFRPPFYFDVFFRFMLASQAITLNNFAFLSLHLSLARARAGALCPESKLPKPSANADDTSATHALPHTRTGAPRNPFRHVRANAQKDNSRRTKLIT